jgi:hypothetical protein
MTVENEFLDLLCAPGTLATLGFLGAALIFWVRRCRRRLIQICEGEAGSISVSPRALRSAICNHCTEEIVGATAMPRVVSHISARTRAGGMRLRIRLRLPRDGNAQRIAQRVQRLGIDVLREQFGFSGACEVDVQITGFLSARIRKERDQAPDSDRTPPEGSGKTD